MKPKPSKAMEKRTHKCILCGKYSSCLSKYELHMRVHTGEKPYKCDICNKPFSKQNNLKRHRQAFHEKLKPLKCTQCAKQFASRQQLANHVRMHTGEKPFECPLCEKRFSQKHNMHKHLQSHIGEKPYKCSNCFRRFCTARELKSHEKIYNGNKLVNHNCIFCFSGFPNFQQLDVHLRSHTGEKPYFCNKCDHSCSQLSSLKKHVTSKHSEGRKFECKICGKIYTKQMQDLQNHIRAHLGEKPYTCPVCKKAFLTREQVTAHKGVHTGVKPFKCEACGTRFGYASGLSKHKKTVH